MSYKIWVKYGDNRPPAKVDFNEGDVDDLKTAIKAKLSNQLKFFDVNQITLRKHGEMVDLDPELVVDRSFENTLNTPVQVFAKSSDHEIDVDEEIQKDDWKWPCFEETQEKGGYWGYTSRKPKGEVKKKQSGVVPFEVVYFTDKEFLCTTFVDLISKPLIDILKGIIPDNSKINDDKPRIKAQDLFHVMDIMKMTEDEKFPDGTVYLKHLVRFLEQEFNQTIKDRIKVIARKVVPFNMLWVFYAKDVKVWYRCKLSDQQIGGIVSSTRLEVETVGSGAKVLVFYITMESVDYDGYGFKNCSVTRQIEYFNGERSFSVLPVVPFEFSNAQEFLKDTITQNGEQFFKLAADVKFMNYEGSLSRWKSVGGCLQPEKITANGRVMIDLKSFATMNPSYPMGNSKPPNKCDVELLGGIYLKDEIPQKTYQLAPALVYGFSFALKEWGQFQVMNLSEICFDTEAFEHLVMPQDKKEILVGLVEQYSQSTKGTKLLDPISNKGQGCIILCHGPPGTGKTLTAESVAESLRRPLWIISIHELGMNPAALENQLVKILDIAFKWKAVVLLDEADVYLEKRDTSDLNRNAMTGVFLRQLEYYQGILFLTTNRVTTFDDAICSRISMFFHYPKLILEERRKVWTNFINRASLSLNADDFAEYELNGREIRNVLHIAQVLAKSQGKDIIVASDTIKIIDIVQGFRNDMNKSGLEVEIQRLCNQCNQNARNGISLLN